MELTYDYDISEQEGEYELTFIFKYELIKTTIRIIGFDNDENKWRSFHDNVKNDNKCSITINSGRRSYVEISYANDEMLNIIHESEYAITNTVIPIIDCRLDFCNSIAGFIDQYKI